jgi:hypothetical protein
MGSHRASAGRSLPELGLRWRQNGANERTPQVVWCRWRESLLVGNTACPPHRWCTRWEAHGLFLGVLGLAPVTAWRGGLTFRPSLCGDIVYHQDPFSDCGLLLRRLVRGRSWLPLAHQLGHSVIVRPPDKRDITRGRG